jgi:adenylate cyclase class IV
MVFIEKELKILQINPVSLIAKLELLGATKNYDKTLYDIYFDDTQATYGSQKKNVRIRFTAAGDCLTLKHRIPNTEYKSAVEMEYDVDGTDTLESLIDQ